MFVVAAVQPLEGSPKFSLTRVGCYYSGGSGAFRSTATCTSCRSLPVALPTPGETPGRRFMAMSPHELVSFIGLCRWSRLLACDGVVPTRSAACRSLECVANGNFADMEPVRGHCCLRPCRPVDWQSENLKKMQNWLFTLPKRCGAYQRNNNLVVEANKYIYWCYSMAIQVR